MSDDNEIKRHFGTLKTEYDAIVVSHNPKIVEVDLENTELKESGLKQLKEALDGLKGHNKSEVNRLIEVAEQWSELQLKNCGNQLEGIELSLEHEDVEVRLAWFATKLLSNVKSLCEALKNEDTVNAAFYSMALMDKLGKVSILCVEHPLSFGLEAFKRAQKSREHNGNTKEAWWEEAKKVIEGLRQATGKLPSTKNVVRVMLGTEGIKTKTSNGAYLKGTPQRSIEDYINQKRKGTKFDRKIVEH